MMFSIGLGIFGLGMFTLGWVAAWGLSPKDCPKYCPNSKKSQI